MADIDIAALNRRMAEFCGLAIVREPHGWRMPRPIKVQIVEAER